LALARRAWCLAALLAAGAAPPDDAQNAFDTGNYARAKLLWTKRADAGDGAAAFHLGQMYEEAEGVPKDYGTAAGWYVRAAKAGYPAAQFNLGTWFDAGRAGVIDPRQAALWYARAAASGFARGAFNLGLMYQDGAGVPENPDMARAWFAAAAPTLPEAEKKLALKPVRPHVVSSLLAKPAAEEQLIVTSSEGASATLVWQAPAEPVPVRYCYTVLGLDKDGRHLVAAGTIDESATKLPIQATYPSYAWRVYAVSATTPDYAPSNWQKFTLSQ
jgi:hypothetical protein